MQLYTATPYVLALSALSAIATAQEPCNGAKPEVEGFKMWLTNTKTRTQWEEEDSSRFNVQNLDDGYIICYEDFGDNIEATMSCADETWMKLDDAVTGERVQTKLEKVEPYFLYGNWEYKKVYGEVIPVGKYIATAEPKNAPENAKSVSFEVVDCLGYIPLNQCDKCGDGEACVGSKCVADGDIRISMTWNGPSDQDYGLKVTTPEGGVIGAFFKRGDPTPESDPASGGYVDEDFKLFGCRSFGVWIKNIVFPSLETAPSGEYQISVEKRDDCGFGLTPREYPFEISVFKSGELVQTFSNADEGLDFTVTL